MIVTVKPIDENNGNVKWHGKKGKDSFTQPKIIEALVDPFSNKYKVDLTDEEIENYSKILGHNLNPIFTGENHEFYGGKLGQVVLENKTTTFNTKNPLDAVRVAILKGSKFVANSQKELEMGLYPKAMFVIYSEQEEIAAKANKFQEQKKAFALIAKMSDETKANIIKVVNGKDVKSRGSDIIDAELSLILDKDLDNFFRYANMDTKTLYVRATILEAIDRNVLRKEGPSVYFMEDMIGYDLEQAIGWFEDPKNAQMKTIILNKLS